MVNFGSLLKNALVVVVLVAVVESGAAAEKLASCCKTVTNVEIKEPILGYLVQRPNPPCVRALQTETGLFCSQVNAPWVRPKIVAFEKAKAKATTPSVASTSPVSLLSIITSTASPSSSPTTLSSSSSFTLLSSSSSLPSSSTSKMPVDETLSEGSAE
uniref:Chemokine interleukin-8-like domain-containing protein n=1 Tax=Amphiprion percula TaxID=161767 RepID=A0A3P8SIT2_AMPPE